MPNISTTLENIDTIAIGGFDGMHRGHQELLKHLGSNGAVLVIDSGYANLTPLLERKRHCSHEIIFFDLDEIRSFSGKEFITKLKVSFSSLKRVVVGYDFHFGNNRSCSTEDLISMFDGEVIVVPEFKQNGISVHARTIRDLISNGDIKKANSLLGYEYSINSTVITGQGLGKKELYPTLNLANNDFLLPKEGVYAAFAQLDNEINHRAAVVFTGHRVSTDGSYALEVHVLNSEVENIKSVRLFIVDYIRDNQKFESLIVLKEAIKKDIEKARVLTSHLAL